MTKVTIMNAKTIRVEMHNTALEAEIYWIDIAGVYRDSKNPIVRVSVSRKNGGCATLNSNVHQTRIGRVCSVARAELKEYAQKFLAECPEGGFDNRPA
jgi:hypothetical protein